MNIAIVKKETLYNDNKEDETIHSNSSREDFPCPGALKNPWGHLSSDNNCFQEEPPHRSSGKKRKEKVGGYKMKGAQKCKANVNEEPEIWSKSFVANFKKSAPAEKTVPDELSTFEEKGASRYAKTGSFMKKQNANIGGQGSRLPEKKRSTGSGSQTRAQLY